MDQLVILQNLEKVARIMRTGGLHPLTRLGRRFVKSLLTENLSVNFDSLKMSAPIELRSFLYQVREGCMEPFMSQLFNHVVGSKSVVLDIGACLGYYALLAAKQGAKVYAFEPDLNIFTFLLANIQKNGFEDRVVAISKAVADRRGTMPFFIHDCAVRNSFFDNSGDVTDTVQVDTVSIDECFDATANVDVIKMDIEGAELGALSGMKQLLANRRDLKLFVESNPSSLRFAGNSPQELLWRLRDLGFGVMIIDEQNRRLAPVFEDTEALKSRINLYCVRH